MISLETLLLLANLLTLVVLSVQQLRAVRWMRHSATVALVITVAQVQVEGPRAAYMPDAAAVTGVFARIHDKPAFVFGHFKYVTTNAMSSAPVAGDRPGYPVLLFLEGATGFRQMNTFQVEELVFAWLHRGGH